MKAFVERLFEEMELSLKEVAKEASSEIQKAEKCGRVVHAILLKLKRFMSGYQFNDSTEEIRFFKEYKPLFYKEMIFYSELTYFESRRPLGNKDIVKGYYHHAMDQIQDFFARKHQLYIYHQLDRLIWMSSCFCEAPNQYLLSRITPLILILLFQLPTVVSLPK